MTTKSNEEFLAEVEDFLSTCNLPALESGNESVVTTATAPPKLPIKHEVAVPSACLRTKDHNRPRTYYERRRAERENLRQQVKELSAKLAEQQKAKRGNPAPSSSSWRFMMLWQRDARLKAEAQQRRLCAAVDTRAALIHEFQTFLHARFGEQKYLTGTKLELMACKHKKNHLGPSDAEIFADYVQGLDTIFGQTDKALRDFGLESTPEKWSAPKQTWTEDSKTGIFLYVDKQTIPADFQETRKLLWQVALMTHRQEDRELFRDTKDPDNTVSLKFRITTRLNSGRIASVVQRIVTRRYHEDGRMVLAWRSLTEGEDKFTGMFADETGWSVVTPFKSNETLLRTCTRHAPMHFCNTWKHKPEVKQFTSLGLDTGCNDVFETTNRLEKLLIREM